eukprot:gnl/TRDRNA2_/TRDRNA2_187393_c0_seq1.p1 gnl/TRDRNA2_/TRDRNA2_187393_c0~~gnl/TRDRNA2_/TRDRNA2_187393_c0_seq1.p1  ORF type:complete len:154 (+),score=46.33 gnl/TRDRNA2_/TRDRNA2_187393_c0_seq1:72-533(+)
MIAMLLRLASLCCCMLAVALGIRNGQLLRQDPHNARLPGNYSQDFKDAVNQTLHTAKDLREAAEILKKVTQGVSNDAAKQQAEMEELSPDPPTAAPAEEEGEEGESSDESAEEAEEESEGKSDEPEEKEDEGPTEMILPAAASSSFLDVSRRA